MDRWLIWAGLALVAVGVVTAVLGLLLSVLGRGGRLLPGDIVVSRPGFTFIFPIVTCLLLSAIITAVLWLVAALRR
jgi:hypothetical protein